MTTRAQETYFPDALIQHLAILGDLRCPDCDGFKCWAASKGYVGRFCSCPFDKGHPW